MQKKSEKIELSVIIPTKNGNERLKNNLDILLNNPGISDNEFEIIIVDSNSEIPFSYDEKENIHIIVSETDIGRAGARNRGIELSSGKRILFIDDDILPCDEFLKKHVEEGKKYPDSAILGKVDYHNEEDSCMNSIWDASYYFKELIHGDEYNFIKFITANISLPSEIVKKSEGFSEEFSGWGYEDIEFGYRLEKKFNMKIIFSEIPLGVHKHDKTFDTYINNFREKGKNALKLYCMHPEIIQELQLEVMNVIDNLESEEYFPDDKIIQDKINSCVELEKMGTWRENTDFKDMLVRFYESLALNVERKSIADELKKIIKPVSVVIIAKNSLRNVLNTLGSIISNKYPLEIVRVIIFDPNRIDELEDFFENYSPPVMLRYMHGTDEDLKVMFKTGKIKDDFVLFIDDTLRASNHWLLFSCLEHLQGKEKITGTILPDTPLGRYLTLKRIHVKDANLKTKNINFSFTRDALVNKNENEIVKFNSSDMIALREVPFMITTLIIDFVKFYRFCSNRDKKERFPKSKFIISFLKYSVHVMRFKKKGFSISDSLAFPIFDKIHYFSNFED